MITPTFVGLLQDMGRAVRPWVTVKPWEQAVRIRAGKQVRLLHAGMYLKLPVIDTATVYPIRLRSEIAALQTLRTKDGKTIVLGVAVIYVIGDLLRVLDSLHNPAGTLINLAQSAICDLVADTDATSLNSTFIRSEVRSKIDAAKYGLKDFDVLITDSADLSRKTFRLLNETRWNHGDAIDEMGKDA